MSRGNRLIDFEHTNYRVVLGTKGTFANAWSYVSMDSTSIRRFRLQ